MGSKRRETWFWAVQSLSIARVVLTFGFVVLCPIATLWPVAASLYLAALLTDFFDGRLARAKRVTSHLGAALDIFGDRYFFVISCLYVGVRGLSLIPLGIILLRELYSVALKMVQINGKGVMVQNRMMGGVGHTLIAFATIGYIISPMHNPPAYFQLPYYLLAAFYLFYLPYSIMKSRHSIQASIIA